MADDKEHTEVKATPRRNRAPKKPDPVEAVPLAEAPADPMVALIDYLETQPGLASAAIPDTDDDLIDRALEVGIIVREYSGRFRLTPKARTLIED